MPTNEKVDLVIHTHVREDALQLFGFADPLEHEVFGLLIAVPNIGPTKAMSILAAPARDIIEYVVQRDPVKLAKLPGIGKKTAERMVVDLHDKMVELRPRASMGATPSSPPAVRSAVVDDLVGAGVEHPSLDDADLRARLERGRREAAQGHVGVGAAALQRVADDDEQFRRCV